jgi:hypothetical protein
MLLSSVLLYIKPTKKTDVSEQYNPDVAFMRCLLLDHENEKDMILRNVG